MEYLDLAFYRCPTAMSRVRKFIHWLADSIHSSATVFTIEPALHGHINAVLNDMGSHLTASIDKREPLDASILAQWKASPAFDEDDLEGAHETIVIRIERKNKRVS